MLSLSSCSNTISSNNSTPPSDSSKTIDSPDSPGGNIINGEYSTEIDYLEGEYGEKIEVQRITSDGEPIACFLCPELCNIYNETVKLCFYSNGEVRYRATSMYEKSFEWRYDKYRGTYTGDPTKKDVEITINFSRKGNFFTYYTYSTKTDKMNESYHAGYEPITENTEAKIKIENDVLKFLECDFKDKHFTDSYKDFIRTSVSDLGPYRYDEIKSREEKYPEILNIPEGYSSIAEDAFCEYASFSEYQDKELGENKLLKKVILPSTIKEIGPYAFYNCLSLEEVIIPETCTIIEEKAFYNCSNLKKIIIPATLKKIGENVFSGDNEGIRNRNLEIEFADGMKQLPDSVLENAVGIKTITIPSSVKKISKKAFRNCYISGVVVIPEGVEEIEEEAFYCTKMNYKDFRFPSTLKTIWPKAFCNNEFETLEIPENVEHIYYYGVGCDSDVYDHKLKELIIHPTLNVGVGQFNIFATKKLEKLKFTGSVYDFRSYICNLGLNSRTDVQYFCGDEDVTLYFTLSHDSNLYKEQWEKLEDGILWTFNGDNGIYTKKTKSGIEKGLWSTDKDSKVLYLYNPEIGKKEYKYSADFNSKSIKIDDEEFEKVTEYSVIEKKEYTSEKWCDSAVLEDGKYVYYQYYLEKVVFDSSYYSFFDTPLFYRYKNDQNVYAYEDKFYQPCKEKIETLLNKRKSFLDIVYLQKEGKKILTMRTESDPQL